MPKHPSPETDDDLDSPRSPYRLQHSGSFNEYFSNTHDLTHDSNDPNYYSSLSSSSFTKPQSATRSNTTPKETYANRAAKVTGDALARFSKAIIGNSTNTSTDFSISGRSSETSSRETSVVGSFSNPSVGFQRAPNLSAQRPTYSRANSSNYSNGYINGSKHVQDVAKKRNLRFTARSDIMAMGPAATENAVAVAGKDFFQILRVENENVTVSQDVRGSHVARDFDKFYTVTDLSWGRNECRRTIALSNSGGQLLVYNIEKTKSVNRLSDGSRAINSINFHQQESFRLVSGSADGSIKLWDLRQQKKTPVISFFKNGDNVREVQFSPFDPNKLAAVYDSGSVIRWDIRYPRVVDLRLNAHTGAGLSLDWHTEYNYIVSGGVDKQIHIWNMSSESRKPEITILNSTSVSKVRWQHDILNSTASSKYGILNSDIVSCNMSLFDHAVNVWNPRRPYIPHYVLKPHSNSVIDIFWRSQSVLWTISRDKTFAQTSLDPGDMEIKRLNSQAFSWTNNNTLSFVVQDRHEEMYFKDAGDHSIAREDERSRKQSVSVTTSPSVTRSLLPPVPPPTESLKLIPAVYTFNFPGTSPEAFNYCAENYFYYDNVLSLERYSKRPFTKAEIKRTTTGLMAVDVCGNNAITAAQAGRFRTSQTWRILQEVIGRERIEFLQRKPVKMPIKDKLKPYASRITESLKSAEPSPMLRPIDDTHASITKMSREGSLDRSYSEALPGLHRSQTKDDTVYSLRQATNLHQYSDFDDYESFAESSDEYDSMSSDNSDSQHVAPSIVSSAFNNIRSNFDGLHSRNSTSSLSREVSNASSMNQLSHSEENLTNSRRTRAFLPGASPSPNFTHRSSSHFSIPSNLRNEISDSSETKGINEDDTTTSIAAKIIPNTSAMAPNQTWADIFGPGAFTNDSNKNDISNISNSISSVPAASKNDDKTECVFEEATAKPLPNLHHFDSISQSLKTEKAASPLSPSLASSLSESSFSTEKGRRPVSTNNQSSSMTPQFSDIARAVAEYASYVSEASDAERESENEVDDQDLENNFDQDTPKNALKTFLTKTTTNASTVSKDSKQNSSIISRNSSDELKHDGPETLRNIIHPNLVSRTNENSSILSEEDDDDGYESMDDDTDDDQVKFKPRIQHISSDLRDSTRKARLPNRRTTKKSMQNLKTKSPENVTPPKPDEVQQVTVAAAIARATHLDDLTKRYHEYQDTLENPWRAEKMIQQVAWYAVEQGDIQMCATLGMLFLRDYPKAFISDKPEHEWNSTFSNESEDEEFKKIFGPRSYGTKRISRKSAAGFNNQEKSFSLLKKGSRVVEEWVMMYLESLRKHGQHVVAAEIVKQCPFPKVQQRGQIETALDPICHLCCTPLAENRSKYGYHNTHTESHDSYHKKRLKHSKIFKNGVPHSSKPSSFKPQKSASINNHLSSSTVVPENREKEEDKKVEYWYCTTCEKLLDGCSYCRLPIKGLSVCLFGCGHKIHTSCLRDWANECDEISDPMADFYNTFHTTNDARPNSNDSASFSNYAFSNENPGDQNAQDGHTFSSSSLTPSPSSSLSNNSASAAEKVSFVSSQQNSRPYNSNVNATNINNFPRGYANAYHSSQEALNNGQTNFQTGTKEKKSASSPQFQRIYPTLECPTGCGTVIVV